MGMAVGPVDMATVAWVGWFRPDRGRWRELTTATDYGACWSALLDAAGRRSGEFIVRRKGVRP